MSLISAILVTHNSIDVIATALLCVSEHQKISNIIVVDNASSDNTVASIRKDFPKVCIIESPLNVGYGRGCNMALEHVKTSFALLLNPDATITHDGIDLLLSTFMAHPSAAIVGPLLEGNGFDASTASIRHPVIHGGATASSGIWSKGIMEVSFVSGALMMWRMEHMRHVGYYDPAIFLFFEDDDLAIRTHAAGYGLLLVKNATATHKIGRSCSLNPDMESLKLQSSAWSYLYIHRKYKGKFIGWKMALHHFVQSLSLFVLYSMCFAFVRWHKLQASRKEHKDRFLAAVHFMYNPQKFHYNG